MNEKEYRLANAKVLVREQESRVREAQRNLDEGYKKGESQVAMARSDAERDYTRLKEELERTKMQLERDKNWVWTCEAELARGYEA